MRVPIQHRVPYVTKALPHPDTFLRIIMAFDKPKVRAYVKEHYPDCLIIWEK